MGARDGRPRRRVDRDVALLQVAGNEVALIVVGAILPVATLFAWARLSALDRTAVAPAELARITAVPMFAPLPVATKEQLARRLERRDVPAGTFVVRAGDYGDSFYLVGDGELEVLVPGEQPRTRGPRATTSARSRSCATCRGPRPCAPSPTPRCSCWAATTS